MTMLVRGGKGRMRASCLIKKERTRRFGHAFVGINLCAFGVCDGDQLQAVYEKRFLKLVCHAQFKATVALLQLVSAYSHVLVRVGLTIESRPFPVAHLAAAHEIRDETKALAVPG